MSDEIFLSWQWIDDACKNLARTIKTKHDCSNAVIYTLPRGGLVPSTIIAHYLDIDTVKTWNIEEYKKDVKLGKRIILIDEIIDSGKQIMSILASIDNYHGKELAWKDHLTLGSLVIRNDGNQSKKDIYEHGNFVRLCSDDSWFVFPWEVTEICYAETQYSWE